jgi:ribose 5-phosphate isomerase B
MYNHGMTVFIGSDHGGFALKNELIEYLQGKNIRVEDLGAYELKIDDDYPVYAKKVAQAVLQNAEEFVGILICRNGVGMDITANRFKGIRCVLGFDELQVQKARQDDTVNMLALPGDYISIEHAEKLVDIFLNTAPKTDAKYPRRLQEIDE